MAVYKNDYSKNEDFALWRLHEIRNKMAKREIRPDLINQSARQIIRQYRNSRKRGQETFTKGVFVSLLSR